MHRTRRGAPVGLVALLLAVVPAAHAAPVSEDFGVVHGPEGSRGFGSSAVLADVNGDGWLDLVAVDVDNERPAAPRGIWLVAGSSAGLDGPLTSLVDAYHLGRRVAVADFMGIGEVQLIDTRFDDSLAPKVDLRRLDAELPVASWPAELGLEEEVWAAGDLDGDGLPEVLVLADVVEEPVLADTTGIWAILGWRDGSLAQLGELTVENGTSGSRVRVGDIDQDGLDDVVISGVETVTLFRGALGTLPSAPSATWYGTNVGPGITLGDFDGDGDLDLAVGEPYTKSDPNSADQAGQIRVYDNVSGIPEPTPAKTLVRPAGSDETWLGRLLVAGDFDDDGFDDLAAVANVMGGGDLIWIFRGGPEGLDDRPSQAIVHGDDPVSSSFAGDVDGDGVDDLVIGTLLAGSEGSEGGAFYLHLGTGEVPEDPDEEPGAAAGGSAPDGSGGGCGCATGGVRPSLWWGLLGALLWRRRARSTP